jgi:superfamily II DNA or RNA helicase
VSSAAISPDPRFTSYQQDLFQRIVEGLLPGSARIVIAPPGTGKSFVVTSAIVALLGAGRITRVLVLAPAALTEQWAHRLTRGNISSAVVDARELRLIKERSGDAGVDWPPGVSVMSMDLAKREDVRDIVAVVPWDLVVLDEAHLFQGQRRTLVEALARRSPAPALLLATATPARSINELAPGAVITDWTPEAARLRAELDRQLSSRTVSYRRSDDEIDLAHGVLDLARRLDRFRGLLLLRRAASSVNALEETLIRLVDVDATAGEGHEFAAPLLERVEQTRSDRRLEAYKELIGGLAKGRTSHAVTFCEFRATLSYVAAAVEGLDYPIRVLHGGMSGAQRDEVLDTFASQGGLLITTDGGSTGASWNFVEAAIHYDLPISAAAFLQRESRYRRFGRTLPCVAYLFRDSSEASAVEELLYRMVQKVSAAGQDLGEDFELALEKILS